MKKVILALAAVSAVSAAVYYGYDRYTIYQSNAKFIAQCENELGQQLRGIQVEKRNKHAFGHSDTAEAMRPLLAAHDQARTNIATSFQAPIVKRIEGVKHEARSDEYMKPDESSYLRMDTTAKITCQKVFLIAVGKM